MKGLKHGKYALSIKLGSYSNDSVAVELVEKDGSSYITLSTNLENDLQDHEHIFVKDYDSHAEIAESMEKLGLLILTDKKGQSGFNTYRLYKLTNLFFKNSEKI